MSNLTTRFKNFILLSIFFLIFFLGINKNSFATFGQVLDPLLLDVKFLYDCQLYNQNDLSQIPLNGLEFKVELTSGWNLISLPVDASIQIKTVFKGIEDSDLPNLLIFRWDDSNQYVQLTTEDNLEAGLGYWIKLPESYQEKGLVLSFTGQLFLHNRQEFSSSWFMGGGLSLISRAKQELEETEELEDRGSVYIYRSGSYVETDEINPGDGFWVLNNKNQGETDILVLDNELNIFLDQEGVEGEKIFSNLVNKNHNPRVGTLPSRDANGNVISNLSVEVDRFGRANYNIPLELPPGIAGLTPELSIHYTSSDYNGPLGLGFSLQGLGSITRRGETFISSDKKTGVSYSNADFFYLNGNKLVSIDGNNGAEGTEYRTEIDTFNKVISYTESGIIGPAYFKVWTKDGLYLEYGKSSDSRVLVEKDGSQVVAEWGLSRMKKNRGLLTGGSIDPDDNEIIFNYYKYEAEAKTLFNNTLIIDSILYAKSKVAVVFEYERRKVDDILSYKFGQLVSLTGRLNHIKTYVDYDSANRTGSLVRDYELSYREKTFKSMLKEIACSVGAKILSPTKFEYQDRINAGKYDFVIENDEDGNSVGTYLVYQDIDGDGSLEIINEKGEVFEFYIDSKLSYDVTKAKAICTKIDSYTLPAPLFESTNGDQNIGVGTKLVDLNGDGILDVVYGNKFYYAEKRYGKEYLGFQDYKYMSSISDEKCFIWNPKSDDENSFYVESDDYFINREIIDSILFSGWKFADAKGDGYTLAQYPGYDQGTETFVDIYVRGKTSLQDIKNYDLVEIENRNPYIIQSSIFNHLLDINGDGLIDLLFHYGDNFTVDNYTSIRNGVFLNNGHGWSDGFSYGYRLKDRLYENGKHQGVIFLDVDGDRLVDYLVSNNNYNEVYLNAGLGWNFNPSTYIIPVSLVYMDKNGVLFLDVNGDGLVDIIESNADVNKIYMNTGKNWEESSYRYTLPVFWRAYSEIRINLATLNSSENSSEYSATNKVKRVKFTDLNKDGLIDLVIEFNMDFLEDKIKKDFLIDVNGDGSVYVEDNIKILWNTGWGWSPNPFLGSKTYLSSSLRKYYGITRKYYGINSEIDLDLSKINFIDLNQDNYLDLVYQESEHKTIVFVYKNYSKLVSKITSGLGETVSITYNDYFCHTEGSSRFNLVSETADSFYPKINIFPRSNLVVSIKSSQSTSSYRYKNYKYDLRGEFLGFESVGKLTYNDLDINEKKPEGHLGEVKTYYQDYPYSGYLKEERRIWLLFPSDENSYIHTYDIFLASHFLNKKVYRYDYIKDYENKIYTLYLREKIEEEYELDSTNKTSPTSLKSKIVTSIKKSYLDQEGETKKISIITYDNEDKAIHQVTINRSYIYNSNSYLQGGYSNYHDNKKLQYIKEEIIHKNLAKIPASLVNTDGKQFYEDEIATEENTLDEKIQNTGYRYYINFSFQTNQTDNSGFSLCGYPGAVKTKEISFSDGRELKEYYYYDKYGSVAKMEWKSLPRGGEATDKEYHKIRFVVYEYGDEYDNRFKTRIINSLGQATSYEYDSGYGRWISKTDGTGTTRRFYDCFGKYIGEENNRGVRTNYSYQFVPSDQKFSGWENPPLDLSYKIITSNNLGTAPRKVEYYNSNNKSCYIAQYSLKGAVESLEQGDFLDSSLYLGTREIIYDKVGFPLSIIHKNFLDEDNSLIVDEEINYLSRDPFGRILESEVISVKEDYIKGDEDIESEKDKVYDGLITEMVSTVYDGYEKITTVYTTGHRILESGDIEEKLSVDKENRERSIYNALGLVSSYHRLSNKAYSYDALGNLIKDALIGTDRFSEYGYHNYHQDDESGEYLKVFSDNGVKMIFSDYNGYGEKISDFIVEEGSDGLYCWERLYDYDRIGQLVDFKEKKHRIVWEANGNRVRLDEFQEETKISTGVYNIDSGSWDNLYKVPNENYERTREDIYEYNDYSPGDYALLSNHRVIVDDQLLVNIIYSSYGEMEEIEIDSSGYYNYLEEDVFSDLKKMGVLQARFGDSYTFDNFGRITERYFADFLEKAPVRFYYNILTGEFLKEEEISE